MDHITHVHLRNVRTFESLDLEVGRPLCVLLGENGAGKSTVLECLELLHAVGRGRFDEAFNRTHRGMYSLLRRGATSLTLGVTIASDKDDRPPSLRYTLELAQLGAGWRVASEVLENAEDGFATFQSDGSTLTFWNEKENSWTRRACEPGKPSIGNDIAPENAEDGGQWQRVRRMVVALMFIEVHIGFDTLASWAARRLQRVETLRTASTLFPAARLELLGTNLAQCWYEISNLSDTKAKEATELVQLGLGERVEKVVLLPDAGGGAIHLALRFKDLEQPVLATELSDGQLAWLSFVAMSLVAPVRSLLAIDEPELHLHPALIGRVVQLLANLPDGCPALISTHSDRVLELVDDPVEALRVCELDGSRSVVRRLDADALAGWLEDYGDVAQLREAGYLHRVLADDESEG